MTRDLLNELLLAKSPFIHCFSFALKSGHRICLASCNESLEIADTIYKPYSGLILDSFEFNDSAHNYIKIIGVFEENGIEENTELEGVEVGIFFYFSEKKLLLEWVTYAFCEIEHNGMRFTMTLASQIFKLQKGLLKSYSTSCRAVYGDDKCGVNTALYKEICDKSFATCCNRYNNAVNFRGEPFIPN